MRLIGCGLLALTFASSGSWAAEHYVEVWNPPEARKPDVHKPADAHKPDARMPAASAHAPSAAVDAHAGAAHSLAPHAPAHHPAAPKLAARRHHAAQALKARAHRPPAAAEAPAIATQPPHAPRPTPGKLIVQQQPAAEPHHAFTVTDIPRQFTPDGNVLRVGAPASPAEVAR